MVNGDAGGGDRLALAVLAQHRMATTQQVHLMISPRCADRADQAAAGEATR
ncbi:hypothetical protein BX257_1284 [Streptomyces sp. 3212.3]|nr:hypothetical protein BX257_1284 [Streptomyces sp. 3212.3]